MVRVESLSWYLPEEMQKANIENMRIECDDDIRALILPDWQQYCWENCAIVLSKLDDATITRFLLELLEWCKDINWPGADIICKRIKQLPKETVRGAFTSVLETARNEKDYQWEEHLQIAFDHWL